MEICVEYNCSRQWIELPTTIEDMKIVYKEDGIEVGDDFEDEFRIVDVDTELNYPLGYYDLDDLNEMADAEMYDLDF